MKYEAVEDNREECIRSAAKLIEKISHIYNHDNPDEKMYSEMYLRIALLLNDIADTTIGKVTPLIEERVEELQQVVQENKSKSKLI